MTDSQTTTSPTEAVRDSSLMILPQELKDEITGHLRPSTNRVLVRTERKVDDGKTLRRFFAGQPSAASVCRELRDATLTDHYSNNTFHFTDNMFDSATLSAFAKSHTYSRLIRRVQARVQAEVKPTTEILRYHFQVTFKAEMGKDGVIHLVECAAVTRNGSLFNDFFGPGAIAHPLDQTPTTKGQAIDVCMCALKAAVEEANKACNGSFRDGAMLQLVMHFADILRSMPQRGYHVCGDCRGVKD